MAKRPKTNSSSQVRAFRKAARELDADESEAGFDAALKTVAKHKPTDEKPSKNKRDNQAD